MQLTKDYQFRKLVAEYLSWIFTTGYDRVLAHKDVCDYLIQNWDVYQGIDFSDRDFNDWRISLGLMMNEFITANVFDSINWPVDENDRAIHKTSNTKMLVDNFCAALEKMKPLVQADLDFWTGKGDKHIVLTGRYRSMDEELAK